MKHQQIRAQYTEDTIIVYQAYNATIADAAIAAQTLAVPAFKQTRMTWIKPSFLWMAYRCGYGTKSNQERILAIEITRKGFETALRNASLSHYDKEFHESYDQWLSTKNSAKVRVQWDPERDLNHKPLEERSIQIGIGPQLVRQYVNEWIVSIKDVTPLMHQIDELRSNRATVREAAGLLPVEDIYNAPQDIRILLGVNC